MITKQAVLWAPGTFHSVHGKTAFYYQNFQTKEATTVTTVMCPSRSFTITNIYSCLRKPVHYRIMHHPERTRHDTFTANTNGSSEVSMGLGRESGVRLSPPPWTPALPLPVQPRPGPWEFGAPWCPVGEAVHSSPADGGVTTLSSPTAHRTGWGHGGRDYSPFYNL